MTLKNISFRACQFAPAHRPSANSQTLGGDVCLNSEQAFDILLVAHQYPHRATKENANYRDHAD